MQAETGVYDDFPELTASYDSQRGYPLIIQPKKPHTHINLTLWATTSASWIKSKLSVHGAILFRGFDVSSPQQFESVSLALEPALESVYLGTSPRNLQPDTTFVHSASEFPGWRIIPSHCEMSFLVSPPSRQFFYAWQPNSSPGGETPIVDFREVYRQMAPAVRDKFERKQIRYIRHYFDAERDSYFARQWDPLKTKSWQSMFNTTDPRVVEDRCAEQAFAAEWSDAVNKRGTLKLVHTMKASRVHPDTMT